MIDTPPYPGLFQVAYVTRDILGAQSLFAETHGVERFMELHNMRYETGPGRHAHCHVALAYVGAIEIELIQPIDGDVAIYRDALPDEGGPLVRFHHLCHRFDTRAAYDAQLDAHRLAGRSLPIVGNAEGIASYFYCDMRDVFGHYVEGIYFDDRAADWIASIPRF